MKNEIYNVDFFISKFESIPEEKWCTGQFVMADAFCALGHCGSRSGKNPTEESRALHILLCDEVRINDGDNEDYQQPTPKQRILAALYDIKKIEQPYQVTHLYIPHIVKIDESILIEVNEN